MKRRVELGVLHCSATPAGREVTRRDIEQWHLKERRWKVVGYKALIHLTGHVEILVPDNGDEWIDPWEITNGAAGYNSFAIHFCYAGGMSSDNKHFQDTRTAAQRISMRNLVFDYIDRYPWIQWCGHHELNAAKDCPSFNTIQWLRAIGVKESNIYVR